MFRSDENPLPFFTIAGKKSSPTHGDRNVATKVAEREKEIRQTMKADEKQARECRLVARNAQKEELQAKEEK